MTAAKAAYFGLLADAAPFLISELDATATPLDSIWPAVAALDTGDYAVAWETRNPDVWGDVWARVVAAAGEPTAASATTVAATSSGEIKPSVAALPGGGYVVLAQQTSSTSSTVKDLELVPVDGTLAPEAVDLATYLSEASMQELGSVARAPDGLWITWVSEGFSGGHGGRAFVGYLLPLD